MPCNSLTEPNCCLIVPSERFRCSLKRSDSLKRAFHYLSTLPMTKYLLMGLMILVTGAARAQVAFPQESLHRPLPPPDKSALFIIQGVPLLPAAFSSLNLEKCAIRRVKVMLPKKARRKYGAMGANGAIWVYPKMATLLNGKPIEDARAFKASINPTTLTSTRVYGDSLKHACDGKGSLNFTEH
jgi:hypothetical protein